MKTITYKLKDLEEKKEKKVTLKLGYVGENEHVQIRIDCSEIWKDYPAAVASLAVEPPEGDKYPAIVTREGNVVCWTVKDSDLVHDGDGRIQLTFTDGSEIQKTLICRTKVDESIIGSGTTPDPIADFVAEANEALAELEAAEVHGPVIGEDGYWYTWNQETGEYEKTETKAQGEDGQQGPAGKDGADGAPGQDGHTPVKGTDYWTQQDQADIVAAAALETVSAVIDDTAGDGDTNKTWSADKIADVTGQLLNAIDGLKDDTEENFANLVTIINGYDYLHEVNTENYFVNYITGNVESFSGLNALQFDVTHVKKFKYNYTIGTPDYRGLAFYNENGTFISGVRTLSEKQDITVPSGAVICKATVDNKSQIEVYEIIAGDPPTELLKEQATYSDKTSGGISYAWSQDHSKITITGTRSGTSFNSMYTNKNGFPDGMEAGGTYRFVFNPVNKNIRLALIAYKNGTEENQRTFENETIWKIPNDWEGVNIRLIVSGSGTVVEETVNCPEIYTIPETPGLSDRVNDLENAVYTNSKDNPLAFIRRDAGLLSIFHTVGCIGDSLASGASAYKESGVVRYTDNYAFSWGQCLARLTGNTYHNFSNGGLSSRTWLSSQHATDCFDGNHNCDIYFIGLGQNDKNNSIPVGTTADINLSDWTQNADTYCGNIGQIIQRLQILQPKAPIFVFIDPLPPMSDQAYNNVIPDIVELFDNVWIIDLLPYKEMFSQSSEIIGSQARSGHYSALGYQQIAFVIATYVDWIVRNNLSAFSQVEFIGTNYEW